MNDKNEFEPNKKQLSLLDLKTKRCSKCGKVKSVSEFNKREKLKNRLRSHCKECRNKYNRKYAKYNPEKAKESQSKWRENNPEKYRENNRKYSKKYRENNPKYQKEWHKKNPEYKKEHQKEYRKRNPEYRLSQNISGLIWYSLKGNKRGYHWENLVGYTLQDLMAHLESQFKESMNWNNYGKWHIDHIRPVSSFNFNSFNDPEFKQCWALKNLQPLWESENISKGNKY